MKKKVSMFRTFKVPIFDKVVTSGGALVPVAQVIDSRLVINDEYCDLRTLKERYDAETKTLTPSGVDCILSAESFLTMHYARRIGDRDTLYDFITVDCSGGSDFDPEVKQVKDLLCFDGLYVPLDKLEAVGYIPHSEAEIVMIGESRFIRYRAVMQSASENRQCKLTVTTYRWENFARTISGDAKYLHHATTSAQKAIARQGLAKTNGNIIKDFDFTFALVPDLEHEITFKARCFDDAKNKITSENLTVLKNANDGCGFITPAKAKELAGKLGLNYVPSAFQVRYGQVKGIILVFDFTKYSNGAIGEDILFTASMWKADFDTEKAEFLVANVSKEPRSCAEFNYQMFTTLNSQFAFDDVLPYVEDVRHYMEKALSSPEDALKFLGVLSSLSSLNNSDDDSDEYAAVDKVSAVIQANPQLAMNIRWVKQSIKKKIVQVSNKMLSGKIPMPRSSVAIMGADPIAFFNRLRVNESGNYSFTDGVPVVPEYKQARELDANEFYCGGFEGKLLAFRNPLTHHAQIRKLNCVSHKGSGYWYKHLSQAIMFNVHDETNLGMGGADFDGDMCFLTKLFVDKFNQTDYIIYNANDTGDKQTKVILTEEVVQRGIRANLAQNMLGVICNINTRALELLNDKKSLDKFVKLAGFMGSKSFGFEKIARMPYYPKFKDMDTAAAYLTKLNHELTTLSELEVDRPKTGYINRFCQNQQEYMLPYMPYWFGYIKGQSEQFLNRPLEEFRQGRNGERIRTLCKNYGGHTVKVLHDILKTGSRSGEPWIQRTIELLTDCDTIMGNIQRYIKDNILNMEVDDSSCYSIVESLKSASCLDIAEAERILDEVRLVYKSYCLEVAANIRAMKDGTLTDEEFNNSFEQILSGCDDRLRVISSDRAATAFAAYSVSVENGYGSQSFPFMVALDGMVALLSDLKTVDFYEIKIRQDIPATATHLIVFNRRFRLPENICPEKKYFGDANLPNGSYELHRDLKGGISLIVPKTTPKSRLNMLPINDKDEFSLKVSYKASELLPEHQNGEYVTSLMAEGMVTFKETTMNGNTQFCVYVGDIWVGSAFDDQNNPWVLKKEAARTLMGKEYRFVRVPRAGVKTDSNSFVTGTGNLRTAQVLTFVLAGVAQATQ